MLTHMYYLKCSYIRTRSPYWCNIQLEYLDRKTNERLAYQVNNDFLVLVTRDKALVQVFPTGTAEKELHVAISDIFNGVQIIKVPACDLIEADSSNLEEIIQKNFIGSLTD